MLQLILCQGTGRGLLGMGTLGQWVLGVPSILGFPGATCPWVPKVLTKKEVTLTPSPCFSPCSPPQTALVTWRNPKPPEIWRMGFREWAGMPLQCPACFYHRASGTPSTTETPQQPWHALQQPKACKRPSSSSPSSTPTAKTQRLAGGDHSQGCNRAYCARCYRLCFSH